VVQAAGLEPATF